jgi:uncharacterized damage-inducible protein DinB
MTREAIAMSPDAPADPRFPIGPFAYAGPASAAARGHLLDQIAECPAALRAALAGLGEEQLDTPYREGGWTVRQVAHHLPDSHLNAYTRCRLALTEDEPTIKPYAEGAWAELVDARTAPAEMSLALLEALHARWVMLLRSLPEAEFARRLVHPESGVMTLDRLLALYAWHGRHHVAQVCALRERKGW